jgi:hypothetical protein
LKTGKSKIKTPAGLVFGWGGVFLLPTWHLGLLKKNRKHSGNFHFYLCVRNWGAKTPSFTITPRKHSQALKPCYLPSDIPDRNYLPGFL